MTAEVTGVTRNTAASGPYDTTPTVSAQTWTLGPEYPVVRCRRCGSHLEPKDIKSGWCWVCGDMGSVEYLREGGDWTK